ncbi:MAG: hypothetical protein IKZ17_03180 [Bacteroidaceae bacterium]|nr:hypothetical protein [Bacteroidaceae bacterium]
MLVLPFFKQVFYIVKRRRNYQYNLVAIGGRSHPYHAALAVKDSPRTAV